jgi:uncharacterized FAD-dependent dehydrogenase
MAREKIDAIIIGAGPAGLFAALELVQSKKKVVVIDMGKSTDKRRCPMSHMARCNHCSPCNIMCGVGGSGTFSDGILNLRPDIGGDLFAQVGNEEKAWDLVRYVDRVFVRCGAPKKVIKGKPADIEILKRTAASVGARFIDIEQRHMGSDLAPKIVKNFETDLKSKGVKFRLNSKVDDLIVEKGKCRGVIVNGKKIRSHHTIMAPGRIGVDWVEQMVREHDIKARYGPIDVGVRVEVPAIIMDPVTRVNRDPKFHIRSRRYDDFVRTFCTNPHGFVVREEYEEGFVAVNGHSMKGKRSKNTNFAFVSRVELTEPLENTTKYGRSIARLSTTIGGGKPIIQKMGDLRRGRRSTPDRIREGHVRNTLKDVTPGDISMALPHRMVMNIIEGLETLDKIIPGVASDHTLLYAPEIKFYAMQVRVGSDFQTSIPGLFAAGDGSGLSRDIINASATGVLAARGITGQN